MSTSPDTGNDFVSSDHRRYRVIMGKITASALSGFIAGVIVASIIFLTGIFISFHLFS